MKLALVALMGTAIALPFAADAQQGKGKGQAMDSTRTTRAVGA